MTTYMPTASKEKHILNPMLNRLIRSQDRCSISYFLHAYFFLPSSEDIVINTREEKVVSYNNKEEQIKALIDGSVFCSQRVEFQCKVTKPV